MDKNLTFLVEAFLRANKRFVSRNAFDFFGEKEGNRIYSMFQKKGLIDSYTKEGVELDMDKLKEFKDSFS